MSKALFSQCRLFWALFCLFPVLMLSDGAGGNDDAQLGIRELQREIQELGARHVREMQELKAQLENEVQDAQLEELKLFKKFMAGENKGERGPRGPEGKAGPRGPPGPPGQQGPPGEVVDHLEYLRRQPALRSCGGFINLQGNSKYVIHRLPTNVTSGYQETCVWIVWATNGGPIQIKLKPTSTVAPFQDQSILAVSNNYTKEDHYMKRLSATYTTHTYNVPFAIIFFHGNSSYQDHGVDFQVSDKGTRKSTLRPKMVTLDANSPSFVYKFPPPPQSKYKANERLFVLVKGAIGLRTKVHVTHIHTEECCDWIRTFSLNITTKTTPSATRYGNGLDINHTSSRLNEPFVLYFQSDGSEEGTGFNLSYSYVQ